MIPNTEQCIELLQKYHTAPRVIAHCKAVARLANDIAALIPVKKNLLNAAALLHDITQGPGKKANEADIISILKKEHITELIPFVNYYSMSAENLLNMQPKEKRILKYCDGRTMEDKIVSVQKRLEEAMTQYPDRAEDFKKCIDILLKWEIEFYGKPQTERVIKDSG